MAHRYEISYGKLRVPIYRVYARPLRGLMPVPESPFLGRDNTLFAAEVDMEVFGNDFLPSYTEGDNSMVVATDSMKNIILRQALEFEGTTIEDYLRQVGMAFINAYAQINDLRLTLRELPFPPALVPEDEGNFHESDVLFSGSERQSSATATLAMKRVDGSPVVTAHESGHTGLRLFKVTGSSFTRFVRDAHTTLPERTDRPLFIYMDIYWTYRNVDDAFGEHAHRYVPAEQVRDICAAVFAEFNSESIQHLVHEMGLRLLERYPQLAEVRFVAQNRTRDPFLASESSPEVKVYSDPFPAYGLIRLRMSRTDEDE